MATTSPSSSVQTARKAIADGLHNLRIDAGFKTTIAFAAATGWDRFKISKIEHLHRPPTVDDVRTWCRVCGVGEAQTEDMVERLRATETAYVEFRRLMRGQGGLKRAQEAKVSLYKRTNAFHAYLSQVVPGPLQTRGYLTAVLTAFSGHLTFPAPADIEAAVQFRLDRSERILARPGARVFLVEEAVLRSRLGGRDVMAEQLDHLLKVIGRPGLTLGVIPFTYERRVFPLESFSVYDGRLVDIETWTAVVTVTAPGEVALYVSIFEELRRKGAVYGDRARALISAAREALDG